MENKVKTIMSGILEVPVDTITEGTRMENVDTWDSLRHMEIVVGIEEAFGVEFEAEDLMAMTSLPDILRVLAAKRSH